MPYIDTAPAQFSIKVRENNFQEQFGALLKQNGWTGGPDGESIALSFKKVVAPSPNASVTQYGLIAKHTIFKNPKGKLFGLAILATYTMDIKDPAIGSSERSAFIEKKFEENKRTTNLYYYMLEEIPKLADKSILEVFGSDIRMAVDIEVFKNEVQIRTGSDGKQIITYPILESQPTVMQSPIVKSTLRLNLEGSQPYPYQETNWWPDSEIRIQGQISADNIFIIIQGDNVPAWENNVIPTVPFYYGLMDPVDPGDDAMVMFAGTAPNSPSFDFSDTTRSASETILPILKTYPSHPSNGIDSVMVSRAKFGARYQSYYLSLNTTPDVMPPDRQNGSKQYPRAWNGLNNEESKYQFNPSRYSNKVHTSKIYLVHPEEGIRGSLSKTVGLSSVNFNAGKLRIRKQNCPTKVFDVYRYHVLGSVSPLTKRPATPYRPIGLGIYDSEFTP